MIESNNIKIDNENALKDLKIIDKDAIYQTLLKELQINKYLLRILIDRGYDTVDSINLFLNGNYKNLLSPYLLPDIEKACFLINKAITEKKKIFIYGDYDCDGICSVSLLKLYFKDKGIEINYYIPDRNNEGYGLNILALNEIINDYKPDLFITVDCGISAYDEIEYLKKSGIEVIITDHHELPQKLPDCITLNGKLSKDIRFNDLCGAGVVLKLIEALSNREYAMQFCDITAIATIADMVPLLNDNRIIVKEGLRLLNAVDKRLGLSLLLQKCKLNNEIKSTDISYIISPHINSAGRIDKAYEVVELFCSKDYFIVDTLTDKLIKYNSLRQELCNKIYKDAIQLLNNYDLSKKIIALYSEEWESGLIGIAAAKLSNEFLRPVVLFSKKHNVLKGSARSFSDINIYEALASFKDKYINFGGHTQACGLSLDVSDFGDFINCINNYLINNYTENDFIFKNKFDYDLDDDILDINNVIELKKLEPFGMGNKKPVFRINHNMNFERLYTSEHLKYIYKKCSIMAFNMQNYQNLFNSKSIINYNVDLSINEYKNTSTVQAIINNYEIIDIDNNLDNELFIDYFKQILNGYEDNLNIEKINDYNDVINMLDDYGTLYITYSLNNFKKLNDNLKSVNKNVSLIYSYKNSLNPVNAICFSPKADFPYNYYKNIVFLERPLSNKIINTIKSVSSAKLYFFDTITDTRDIMINNLILNKILRNINDLIRDNVYFNNIDTLFCCLKNIQKDTYEDKDTKAKKDVTDNQNIDLLTFTISFFILYELKAISVDKNFNIKILKKDFDYTKSNYRRYFKEKNE